MTVRYFGREGFDNSLSSASSPVSEGSPAIEEVFRGEFDENELFVSENVWRPDLNKWVDTRAVSELWFMGEGNLIKITEEQAMEETIVATRQYVRRQETWFKRDQRIQWIGEEVSRLPFIEERINS